MYPTPPSHETNKSHSPETMTDVTNEGILTGAPIGTFHSSLESTAPSVIDPVTNIKASHFFSIFYIYCYLCGKMKLKKNIYFYRVWNSY